MHFTSRLAVVLLVALCPAGVVWAQKSVAAVGQPDLFWPLPPEKPRFRFVQEIHGSSDVSPSHKMSTLQKLAGVRKVEFKPVLVKPFGIATDSKHRIYVTDTAQAVVFVFDRENHAVSYIGMEGNPKLQTPMGIHVDAKDRVWLADGSAHRIYAFDPKLTLRAAIGKPGDLLNPVGLATDLSRNRLYVADSRLHCIVVYDTETGLLITKFGKRGTANGDFNFPTDVTVDAKGRIYVADTMNRRVQIFDPEYKYVDSLGSEGLAWGHFRKPKSVALDSYQNIYVLDSDFCNFQIFNQKKQLLMFLGDWGAGPGQFTVPQRIFIDRDDLVYVADQMNGRIEIFKLLSGTSEESAPAHAVPPAK